MSVATPLVTYNHTELMRCIFDRDVNQAVSLIENNSDLDKTDIHGFSPLMYAIRNRLYEVTKCLILKGCNVNIQNKENQSALHLVVKGFYRKPKKKDDWLKFLDILLEKGADVNLIDSRDFSPLMCAIKHNQVEIVERLLKAGADVNIYNGRGEWCLHLAVKALVKNTHILELLLSNGAEVNAMDPQEFTPLMWAVINSNYDMVAMLIQAGAEVNFFNSYSDTCLHLAVKLEKPNMEVIEFLLANDADVNSLDYESKTPLERLLEAYSNKSVKTEIGMKLLSRGSILHLFNFSCKPMLVLAIEKGLDELIQLLIDNGSDVNSVDMENKTPLCYNISRKTTLELAIENGLDELIQPLIDNGSDVNSVDTENKTPLCYAFVNRFIKILIILLENGADPNIAFLENFHKYFPFGGHSIASANMLTALIKYGLRSDALPHHDTYPGLLCYCLMQKDYVFDDITYLFDILYLSGSATQKQLLLLIDELKMKSLCNNGEWVVKIGSRTWTYKENSQSEGRKRDWVIEKCSQPLTLKEMSRIQILKSRKENIISKFVENLPIMPSLRDYLQFSEFEIDDRQENGKFDCAILELYLTSPVLIDTPISYRSFWEEFSSNITQ